MTEKQYIQVAQDFAKYANKTVKYKRMDLYRNVYKIDTARLEGVGVLGNNGNFILACDGHAMAIHYKHVYFPK